MGWVIFEVFLALGLAIFIVWWTLPRARKKGKQAEDATLPDKNGGSPP